MNQELSRQLNKIRLIFIKKVLSLSKDFFAYSPAGYILNGMKKYVLAIGIVIIIILVFFFAAACGGAQHSSIYNNYELLFIRMCRILDFPKTPKDNYKISGNKDDLVSFSVKPGDTVSGVLNFVGTVKGAYFFEANIGINILDENKQLLKAGNAMATSDWMTSGAVSFEGSIDLSGLPSGKGYIQIANDNASGLPENDKFIYIPIVINEGQN